MKEKLRRALDNMKKYNRGIMFQEVFGFDPDTVYDVLVIAPGWQPDRIIADPSYRVTLLSRHAYFAGYLVEKDGRKAAWAQTASGACNVLDHALICAELQFRKCVFAGAVGGLTDAFRVGDLCTPEVCISGVYANRYFDETLPHFQPFERLYPNAGYMKTVVTLAKNAGYDLKPSKVFCTDSICMEYSHLDEIRGTGAELIEMETGTFYTLAELFEVPSIALLAVSDNSATGAPLLGRDKELEKAYRHTRGDVIPDMIFRIAAD